MVAVHDALQIARAAESDDRLRDAARADALVLRARFIADPSGVRARSAPYVGSVESGPRSTRWVVKGPGKDARVRVIERRRVA
jgi:hypothetical protein